jgi:hypothetical protein
LASANTSAITAAWNRAPAIRAIPGRRVRSAYRSTRANSSTVSRYANQIQCFICDQASPASALPLNASLTMSAVNSAAATPIRSSAISETTRAMRRSVSIRRMNDTSGGRFCRTSRSGSRT